MTSLDNIRAWLIANGLDADYKVQPYEWADTGTLTD